MKTSFSFCLILFVLSGFLFTSCSSSESRVRSNFGEGWKFSLITDSLEYHSADFDDSAWRSLDLPHDWSIEGEFSETNPATPGGGALPGGIGWYRKRFSLPVSDSAKVFYIDFDGVYKNSEVWINGFYLGKRPYGYSSFRYELSSHLNFGDKENIIAVKVDNSKQPNSRWYSGSGIYRNVWLVKTGKVHVDHWGTQILTPSVSEKSAEIEISTNIVNKDSKVVDGVLETSILDKNGNSILTQKSEIKIVEGFNFILNQKFTLENPILWTLEDPAMYVAVNKIIVDNIIIDEYKTEFGVRSFTFDREQGFILNGKKTKILGVCNHHDLGCLGAAINVRALERQLEILKEMGCNGIRTSHNPPAPELLDLCDKMGFIVMDEAFDMWKKKKTTYDYSNDWDEWHKRDLQDLILRDRNHPSVFIWSIGNEILEQWDSTGISIAKELAGIVREIDNSRPVTSACNETRPINFIIKSDVLDLIGYNYHHAEYADFLTTYPKGAFIGTETTSALATRGYYDMKSDSIRRWPVRWDLPFDGNPDHTCSAYDNCSAPWGSTHEESWKVIKKHDFLSGMFIWTGFDYLGEPTPYGWPSRSSYFGIIDLAGFPKDAYYMYQSEWKKEPMIHLFPHWNWTEGDSIDMWVYSNAAEVELFLNEISLGTKKKVGDELHLQWRVKYSPGEVKAIGRTEGMEDLIASVKTAGKAAKIQLVADRNLIKSDGQDLSFISINILDENGNLVPDAENNVVFTINGEADLAGVDNGNPVSHESFKANSRKAFHGKCLLVVKSRKSAGKVEVIAESEGLAKGSLEIEIK